MLKTRLKQQNQPLFIRNNIQMYQANLNQNSIKIGFKANDTEAWLLLYTIKQYIQKEYRKVINYVPNNTA